MKGKTVLITGASRGIGAALARRFAAGGAFVWINYRVRQREADGLAAEIAAGGGRAEPLAFDVREPPAVEKAVETVLGRCGRIDVLVNNAAVVADGPVAMLSDERWRTVIDTNLTGVFHCVRAVAPRMMQLKQGAIVNVASVAGVRASPGQANYSAAKGGVVSLTRTLSAELGPSGIRCNAVVPGLINAGMGARLNRDIAAERTRRIPLGKFGEAEDVAEAVLFLASDAARYITGQILAVDGGLSL